VRSIKLRGALSQGMVIKYTDQLEQYFPGLMHGKHQSGVAPGDDVAEILGITRYEPPAAKGQGGNPSYVVRKGHPDFTKFTDIENFKHYPTEFGLADLVYITEKLHGTSVRYALLATQVNTWRKRLRQFLSSFLWGVEGLPSHEFCYGSRNVQLQHRRQLYYETDVYSLMAVQEDIEAKLRPGETLYGEIVGDGIQKNYTYGCGTKEWAFYAYDVKVGGRYLDTVDFLEWCRNRRIQPVPMLFMGNLETLDGGLDKLRGGASEVRDLEGNSTQAVREGVVIKSLKEERAVFGRRVLKVINDDYALQLDNTDFH